MSFYAEKTTDLELSWKIFKNFHYNYCSFNSDTL